MFYNHLSNSLQEISVLISVSVQIIPPYPTYKPKRKSPIQEHYFIFSLGKYSYIVNTSTYKSARERVIPPPDNQM